jgi:hypothetical protein
MLLKRIFPVALTIVVGLLVLVSYVLPTIEIQIGSSQPYTLAGLRAVLVEWGIILAAFALLLGFLNLLAVHFRRIQRRQGVVYSLALIVSAGVTFGLWVGSALRQDTAFLDSVFSIVILPAQSALGALLAIVLAAAGFRALRRRRSIGMILFVLTAVVVAVTQPINTGLFGNLPGLIRVLVIDPITTGGVRGLLLGVAIGSLAVGLRVLVGADKPQSD